MGAITHRELRLVSNLRLKRIARTGSVLVFEHKDVRDADS